MDERLADVVAGVSQVLIMPNIESLFLHFEVNRPTTLNELAVFDMFPTNPDIAALSKLRKLELGASRANGLSTDLAPDAFSSLLKNFLPDLLKRFPSTENLTLSIPYALSFETNEAEGVVGQLVRLRSLRLEECSHLLLDDLLATLAAVFENEEARLEVLTLPDGLSNPQKLTESLRERLKTNSFVVFE